jgi:hypothetical protein
MQNGARQPQCAIEMLKGRRLVSVAHEIIAAGDEVFTSFCLGFASRKTNEEPSTPATCRLFYASRIDERSGNPATYRRCSCTGGRCSDRSLTRFISRWIDRYDALFGCRRAECMSVLFLSATSLNERLWPGFRTQVSKHRRHLLQKDRSTSLCLQ